MPRLTGQKVRDDYKQEIDALVGLEFTRADINTYLQLDKHPDAAKNAFLQLRADLCESNSPKYLQAALREVSPKQLIAAVRYPGTADKLSELLGLFTAPAGQPETTVWAQLMAEDGIDAKAVLKLLSTHGGSKNLAALRDLFAAPAGQPDTTI